MALNKGDRVLVKTGPWQGHNGVITEENITVWGHRTYDVEIIHEGQAQKIILYDTDLERYALPIFLAQEHIQKSIPHTIREAFEMDMADKKPKYSEFAQERVKQGRCPVCNELGRYHLSTPICSQHGPY